jgi:hypothetical protein
VFLVCLVGRNVLTTSCHWRHVVLGSILTSPIAAGKSCKPALLITFYSFILPLLTTLFELRRSHTRQCQCARKTLTNDEYVRIWKDAVVCCIVVLHLGILRKCTKAQPGYPCRWWYITWRWFPTTVCHYEAVRTYPRFDRHCSIVRCRQMSRCFVRTFEMCGMNVPLNGTKIRSGQEFENLLLQFQRSSYWGVIENKTTSQLPIRV